MVNTKTEAFVSQMMKNSINGRVFPVSETEAFARLNFGMHGYSIDALVQSLEPLQPQPIHVQWYESEQRMAEYIAKIGNAHLYAVWDMIYLMGDITQINSIGELIHKHDLSSIPENLPKPIRTKTGTSWAHIVFPFDSFHPEHLPREFRKQFVYSHGSVNTTGGESYFSTHVTKYRDTIVAAWIDNVHVAGPHEDIRKAVKSISGSRPLTVPTVKLYC